MATGSINKTQNCGIFMCDIAIDRAVKNFSNKGIKSNSNYSTKKEPITE